MWKGLAAALGLGTALMAPRAEALVVCNCCVEQADTSCPRTCAAIAAPAGQCPVVVDYEGRRGHTPLNGFSFAGISLGDPDARRLENFRRFIERHRNRARRAYEAAIAAFDASRIDAADFAAAKALFREAMVNYNHAAHAYLIAIGKKTD